MPNGLATSHLLGHTARAVRGPAYPAPETVSAANTHVADVVALPRRPRRPTRDGVTRVGALAALDAQHRVGAGKVATALGWTSDTKLTAVTSGGVATVVADAADTPFAVPVSLDAERRLTLPPTLTGALGVLAGEQVLLVALPARGELQLLAAADALQSITGPLQNPDGDSDRASGETVDLRPAGRSRVTPRWRPAR